MTRGVELLSVSGTLASTVGEANHLRYRGYYYDTESGLYYLQSRYYNPEIGRFISKDDPSYCKGVDELNSNLYAYCQNNPVMLSDPSGRDAIWLSSDFSPFNLYNLGHAAICIQYKNKWYYASFEPFAYNYKIPDIDIIFGEVTKWVKNKKIDCTKAKVNYETSDPYYKKHNLPTKKEFKLDKYKEQIYIKYNFDNDTYNKAKKYSVKPPVYNFTHQNCGWIALYLLQLGTSGKVYDKIEEKLYNHRWYPFVGWVRHGHKIIIPNKIKKDIPSLFS